MAPKKHSSSSESEEESVDDSLTKYKYSDLNTLKSIRLLILQPGSRKSPEVVCELIEVQLETEETKGKQDPVEDANRAAANGNTVNGAQNRAANGTGQDGNENGAHNGAQNGTEGAARHGTANGTQTGTQDAEQPGDERDEEGASSTDEGQQGSAEAGNSQYGAQSSNGTDRPNARAHSNIPVGGTDDAPNANGQGNAQKTKRKGDLEDDDRPKKKSKRKRRIPVLGSPGAPKEYEALSWSWGRVPWDSKIQIHENGESFYFEATESLVDALKALRRKRRNRVLWIDVVCINQREPDEKNQQVSMMSEIYGQARNVCVWLGKEDEDSKVAFDFIREEVILLQDFDNLCKKQDATPKWNAMFNLMKRPWFSRRWVVQEIALAKEAMIYCGRQKIKWDDFADAVQLFVEVETATHRLSEVMQKDPNFYHVPRWFDYVSELGASLLVEATGTLFRMSKNKRRTKLLSLEYLVSNLSIFGAAEPRDTIYALLAIAKDTAPIPLLRGKHQSRTPSEKVLEKLVNFKAKGYAVDYRQPYVDICQQFIQFAIRQQPERTRALDIICRPWAPPPSSTNILAPPDEEPLGKFGKKKEDEDEELPSWVPKLSGAAYAMFEHTDGVTKMGRQNADPLVGLPSLTQRNYSAAGDKEVNLARIRFKKREGAYSMYVLGFILDRVGKVEDPSQNGNIPNKWFSAGGWDRRKDHPPEGFNFEEFWRTLVGDRARLGRNPPTYYARAFKMSLGKGLSSGALNTTELIDNGRCSVVAEFFRRVQAVIWNRSLIRTASGNLGIAREDVKESDLVCILHGCSVPVILRPVLRTAEDIDEEKKHDARELAGNEVTRALALKYYRKWKRWLDERRKTGTERPRKKDWKLWQDKREVLVSENPENLKSEAWLRNNPRSFYWQFLGECYVHRVMDGEALDMVSQSVVESMKEKTDEKRKDKIIREQLFELR